MATTSLWRIRGRLGNAVDYIDNPDKTGNPERITVTGQALDDVINYESREEATNLKQLVKGINLDPEKAREEMLQVKRKFKKEDGTIAYHGYQSFAEGEVTPELALRIGIDLATELWGDRYQVLVCTHLDKASHIHNHFLINTVSFLDGKKFFRSNDDYRKMREASDRLCRKYGLSVIKHPEGKGKNYGEWMAEKKSEPTWRSMIRKDIDRAISGSLTEREFFREMERMGYEFKLYSSKGEPLMRPSLKPKDSKRFFRFDRLGEDYALDEIKDRILENIRRNVPFPEEEQKRLRKYREEHPPHPKARGLAALYFYYCYQLHIIVKFPASAKRVSSYMREDIRRLDQLDEQTRLLGKNHIETLDDLNDFRENVKGDIDTLDKKRKDLRGQLRAAVKAGNNPEADRLRLEIAQINKRLKEHRHSLKVADRIEERAEHLEEMKQQLIGLSDPAEPEKTEPEDKDRKRVDNKRKR